MTPAARLQLLIDLTEYTIDEYGNVIEPLVKLSADEIIALLDME